MADSAGFLVVGAVQKPHGIKGELFVRVETDHPAAIFVPGRVLRLGDARGVPGAESITVERARPFKGGMLVKTAEFSGRDERLELLRGSSLLIPEGDVAPLADDEVFVHHLIGLRVLASGIEVGTVREVYDAPGGWYLGVEREGRKELLLPFVSEMVKRVDPEAGVVEIEPPAGLLEL
jgi:16S rRNA processing protein RimM